MVTLHLAALLFAASTPGDTVLLDFYSDSCGPCRAMQPVVAQLEAAGHPVRRVNVEQEGELAARFRVQGVPTFVMVSQGREVGRLTGAVPRRELEKLLANAGTPAAARLADVKRRPDPFAGRGERFEPAGADEQSVPVRTTASGPLEGRDASPRSAANALVERSVRLTIEDPQGTSYGTGTIIDARSGEALVLTCGHVFRDSHGKGRISVDLFVPGAQGKLPGQLIGYDLKRDVGLVSFRPGRTVPVARVAPAGYRLERGAPVASVGCNHGEPATVQEGQILAIDKFVGEPNVQVSGQPVQGRSGGGLFSAEGLLIGVCNAADPTDDAGLYSALGAIHAQLNEMQLADVYQSTGRAAENVIALTDGAAAADAKSEAVVPIRSAALTSAGELSEPPAVESLSTSERATLHELEKRSQGAEVICIVRPRGDGAGKSEVFVLDQASPAFQQLLAASRAGAASPQLTSLAVPRAPAPAAAPRAALRSDAPRGSVHYYRR